MKVLQNRRSEAMRRMVVVFVPVAIVLFVLGPFLLKERKGLSVSSFTPLDEVIRIEDYKTRIEVWEKYVVPHLDGNIKDITLPAGVVGVAKETGNAVDQNDVPVFEAIDNEVEPLLDRKPTPQDYLDRYNKQLEYCGDVCSLKGIQLRKFPVNVRTLKEAYISRPILCHRFFSKRAESIFDGAPLEWPPPLTPPLDRKFLLNGNPEHSFYLAQKYEGSVAATPTWTKQMIEEDLQRLRSGSLEGT